MVTTIVSKYDADSVCIKKCGDHYFRNYNNGEIIQLIDQIIERYDLNKNLEHKRYNLSFSPNFTEVNKDIESKRAKCLIR